MFKRGRGARWAIAALFALTLGGLGIAFGAGTLAPGPGNNYIGCVVPRSGNLSIVSSVSQCPKGNAVVYLAGSQVQQTASVSCPGQSIQAAIDAAPVNLPLTVYVTGTCTENVSIYRDNVSLGVEMGAPRAGITAADASRPVVDVGSSTGISLHHLTLAGGSTGLSVGLGGSVISANDLAITGTVLGVDLRSAHLDMTDSDIWTTGQLGLLAFNGSVAWLHGVTVEGATESGVSAYGGSAVNISDAFGSNSLIQNNADGVSADANSTVDLSGGTQVKNNTGFAGVQVSEGSRLILEGAVIEDNTGDGVRISGASSGFFREDSIISGNGGNGVSVHDVSLAGFGAPTATATITNNTGWGLFCVSPEARKTGTPPIVSGNNGTPGPENQDNCPLAD